MSTSPSESQGDMVVSPATSPAPYQRRVFLSCPRYSRTSRVLSIVPCWWIVVIRPRGDTRWHQGNFVWGKLLALRIKSICRKRERRPMLDWDDDSGSSRGVGEVGGNFGSGCSGGAKPRNERRAPTAKRALLRKAGSGPLIHCSSVGCPRHLTPLFSGGCSRPTKGAGKGGIMSSHRGAPPTASACPRPVRGVGAGEILSSRQSRHGGLSPWAGRKVWGERWNWNGVAFRSLHSNTHTSLPRTRNGAKGTALRQ